MATGADRLTYFTRVREELRNVHGVSEVEMLGENEHGVAEFNVFLSGEMRIRVQEEQRENQRSNWLDGVKRELRECGATVNTFDESQSVLRVNVPYEPEF